jgi:hypothetical protein
MGIAVFPAPSAGITVSDGNNAGWNLGETQWEQISEYKSATSVAAIDFTSIPQTYRSLRLQIVGLTISTNDDVYLRINNDSTASTYSRFWLNLVGNTWSNNLQHSQSRFTLTNNTVSGGNTFHSFIEFPNYTLDRAKQINWKNWYSSTTNNEHTQAMGTFRKGTTTPAITSLRLLTNGTNMYFDSNEALAATLWGCK